jgi:cystathionine beta-lyase
MSLRFKSAAANPTRSALENALASLENGARGLAFHLG